jgi:hypothetical protein
MTQLQKKDAEIAELREKVALLEGLIEQVIRLHYPGALEGLTPPPWVQELLARDTFRASPGVGSC